MSQSRERLKADLVLDEGIVLHAYQDSLGYLTIGVGRLIDQRKGGGINKAEAMMLLEHDIDRIEGAVLLRWPWVGALDDVRQRVLLNMAFNLGVVGLAKFRLTLSHVQAGRYADAANAMLDSRWAGQVGARAVRLAAMMRGASDG